MFLGLIIVCLFSHFALTKASRCLGCVCYDHAGVVNCDGQTVEEVEILINHFDLKFARTFLARGLKGIMDTNLFRDSSLQSLETVELAGNVMIDFCFTENKFSDINLTPCNDLGSYNAEITNPNNCVHTGTQVTTCDIGLNVRIHLKDCTGDKHFFEGNGVTDWVVLPQ